MPNDMLLSVRVSYLLLCWYLTPLCIFNAEKVGAKGYKYISVAPYERCKDLPHLEIFLQDVLDKGGEGIILRDPQSPYQPGRSYGYLKHKVSVCL